MYHGHEVKDQESSLWVEKLTVQSRYDLPRRRKHYYFNVNLKDIIKFFAWFFIHNCSLGNFFFKYLIFQMKRDKFWAVHEFFITYITSKYKNIIKLSKKINKKQENFRCCSILGKEIFAEKQFSLKMPNFSISEYVMT